MGEAARMKYGHLSPKVQEGATPIFIITKEFAVKKGRKKHFATYKVTQFPFLELRLEIVQFQIVLLDPARAYL